MIKRYTRKEMGELWSLQNEFQVMLDVEIAACDAMAEIREIPQEAVKNIKEKATFTVERIAEIEKETNHDIISFVTAVQENVGEGGQYIHKGLTSSDVKDTALAVMMKRSAEIILDDLKRLSEVLLRRAKEHKYTPCIGRTHGIHAEPMTLGLKFILWYDENERNIKRVEEAKKQVSVGKLSGAVGTYSNIDPRIEEIVCKKLGIEADKVSTQIIQRDRHAQYLTTLAIVASSLEKFATEIRNLQRTDIREAEEYFSEKQKGSSAMPHKRNPITCERISGLARIVRGNALASMEDITLWHERDISHSSVERVILPDSTIAVDYAINKFIDIVDKLLIYPEAMKANIEKTGGLIFSQRILISLVNKGIDRDNAYRWVQRNAMKRWLNNEDFRENVHKDEDITKYLSSQEIDDCFDYAYYLRNIDVIMKRFGI
ncbi:adenylosuccinate lyase [Brachyspira hyodysenteriae]|uniref:adenylosuccinate lyase n=1 Tax=Brachyspira hyodysenteriae TaxID=159 RepID=UPI001BFE0934|nr:adenylosuccinate lyase [Brachyspira hyodysenteriae]MBT8753688.1 adenylosuccinate lyase [Brachyspira hyodysenteriae]